jgi:hypothetical protein
VYRRADYQRFRETFRREYEVLDARGGALTGSEKQVADFERTQQEIA